MSQGNAETKEWNPLATTTKKRDVIESVDIIDVQQGEATFRVVGSTPLIMQRVGEKARRELLLPRGRLNTAERATTLKHEPLVEFISGLYLMRDPLAPTAVGMPSEAFKKALGTAALDLPGTNKAQIGRLTYVVGDYVHIYGVPEMLMSVVRSADIKRTPDIRTRPIFRHWAAEITVRYVIPIMNAEAIVRLLVTAGMTVGIGDWRQEKGGGNYGLYRVIDNDDPSDASLFETIVKTGDKAAQLSVIEPIKAYNEAVAAGRMPSEAPTPPFYDDPTENDYNYYVQERERRKRKGTGK